MWVQIILFVITSFVSYLLRPKPPAGPQPGKVDIPTVEEGRKLGVLFGTRWLKAPHVYWWGDVKTTAIKR
ncbi:MAG: hypothetical protein LT080_10435 [Thiobacillus sp.]|nr:hypothetical protein [Thiobacillus sp.]